MVVVVVVVGLVRRRARLALLAGGAFFAAVASAELLKAVLPRPSYGTELAILASKDYDTYPSGHATIATGFVLALVMVNNNRWRPLVALLGLLWSSAVATGVVAAGWHRPSDAIGGIALATAWLSLSAAFLSRERGLAAEPGRLARALPALAATLATLVVVTAVVLALTSSQARQPADVAWWAFPIGQITIDLTAIAAVGTYAWLLKDLRFGDPTSRSESNATASAHRGRHPGRHPDAARRPQPAKAERSEGRHPSIDTERRAVRRSGAAARAKRGPGDEGAGVTEPSLRRHPTQGSYAAGTAPPRPRSGGGRDATSASEELGAERQPSAGGGT